MREREEKNLICKIQRFKDLGSMINVRASSLHKYNFLNAKCSKFCVVDAVNKYIKFIQTLIN